MNNSTVLVVESNSVVLHHSIGIVEDAGFTALGASSGETAISMLEDHPEVETTVVDVDAPGSGAFMRMVRRAFPRIRLITTGTSAAKEYASARLGSRHFQKPFRSADIAASLKRAA